MVRLLIVHSKTPFEKTRQGICCRRISCFALWVLFNTGGYMSNPRYSNGNLRRKYRARFKAMDAPCGICSGRFGPIHYNEPSDYKHPLSFVIDEIKPISRYKEFGYESREAAARDWNNLQAAHYCCNAAKSNKVATIATKKIQQTSATSTAW